MRYFKQDVGLFLRKAKGWKSIGYIYCPEFYPEFVDSREYPEVFFHNETKMFSFLFNDTLATISVLDSMAFYLSYIMDSDYDEDDIFENYRAFVLLHEIGA